MELTFYLTIKISTDYKHMIQQSHEAILDTYITVIFPFIISMRLSLQVTCHFAFRTVRP